MEEVSGRVEISTGDSPLKSSGSIAIKTGDAFVEKGSIEIATGKTIDGSESNSGGDIILKAGISEGILTMTSGSKSVLSSNGEVLLTTSTSKQGSSSIFIQSGASNAASGNMTLSTGVSTTGAAGDIKIRPHDSNSVDAPGGNIHISGGTNKRSEGSLVSIESGSSDENYWSDTTW